MNSSIGKRSPRDGSESVEKTNDGFNGDNVGQRMRSNEVIKG